MQSYHKYVMKLRENLIPVYVTDSHLTYASCHCRKFFNKAWQGQ